MLKLFAIKAFLVNVFIQQVVGSYFYIVEVDKIKSTETIDHGKYMAYFHYFEQKDNGFNKTLLDQCQMGIGYDQVIFHEEHEGNSYAPCTLDMSNTKDHKFIYPLGVGNEYLTSLDVRTFSNSQYPTIFPCIRTDNNYRFTTYTCAENIPKDLVEVPKYLPNPRPTVTTTVSRPTSTSISSSSTVVTTVVTTSSKSSSSLKPTSTSAPKCTTGYCGKKRGNGPTGACCSSNDDCSDTCNSNGKCGVSDETGEPKTTCPA